MKTKGTIKLVFTSWMLMVLFGMNIYAADSQTTRIYNVASGGKFTIYATDINDIKTFEKKPRIYMTYINKRGKIRKKRLKVINKNKDFPADSVTCVWKSKKTVPGTYKLFLQPKAKGKKYSPVRISDSFNIVKSTQQSANFVLSSDWGSGFVAEMKVTNNTGQDINGWIVEFDFPYDITNIWNAEISSHNGNHYIIRNTSWNKIINADETVSFGFQGTPGDVNVNPYNIVFNGGSVETENSPPIAENDLAETEQNKSVIIPVLNNDSDPDGDSLTVSNVSPPNNGNAEISSDRLSVVYTPNTNFIGSDTFEYVVDDGQGKNSTGSVNVTIKSNQQPSGTIFTVTGDWGSGFTANMSVNNSSPHNVDNWTIEFDFPYNITNIWNAEIISHSNNHYVIGNASWNGTVNSGKSVSFGFQGIPGNIAIFPYNISFNGNPVIHTNSPPIANNDSKTTEKNISVSINVLENDSDADGDRLAVTHIGNAMHGQTEISVDTFNIIYSPAPEFVGTDTFRYTISDGNGGTASATVSVSVNGTPPPVTPDISISDVSVVEPDFKTQISGFLHTSGNQILDSDNNPVRIAGVNWFGLETMNFAPHGLWSRSYKDFMDQIKELGFNTIRLPFSNELFDSSSIPNGIDFSLNPELTGLSGIEIMDKIVEYAKQIGLRIILDHHRSSAGSGADGSGLWYDSNYPESRWIDDWKMLANRYRNNSAVIGADLHNEPHGPATWGNNASTDWRLAAERAGNAILETNSNWLILVEGIEFYDGTDYWWGGNLKGARDYPVRLNVSNRLVYSPHAYPNSIYSQTWFSDPEFPNNLFDKWTEIWGYLYKDNIAPIMIGEFGSKFEDPKDGPWMEKLLEYMNMDVKLGEQGISWTWWSWNPNSGDTGGILQDDWSHIHQDKVDMLNPLMFDFPAVTDTQGDSVHDIKKVTLTVSLSLASDKTVSVDYRTEDQTAFSDEDYLSTSSKLIFSPGETSKSITVSILGDLNKEFNETFIIQLDNPVNAYIINNLAVCTIIDNDSEPVTTSKKIIGYYPNWAIYRNPSFKPESIDADKITHINYAFADVDTQGNIKLIDSWADIDYRNDWNSQKPYWGNFRQLADLKQKHPHLKVLISIGGWTLSNNFPAMAASQTARTNFIQKCIEFCEIYDCFDGIDIDWEYPGFAEHSGTPEDKTNYTLLLKEMHSAFKAHNPQLVLTIAAPAGPWHYRNMEVDKIHNYLDWINLMTYDFHGPWGGPEDQVTNHQSALTKTQYGDPELNINSAVNYYRSQGVPKEKLVVGIPLYGKSYASANSTSDGLNSTYSGVGSGTTSEKGVVFFSDIKKNLLNKYVRYWDDTAQVPYLHDENNASPTYGEFISYDDEESIRRKCEYIKLNGLGGAMVWELGLDTWTDNWDAMNTISKNLK